MLVCFCGPFSGEFRSVAQEITEETEKYLLRFDLRYLRFLFVR